MTIHLLTSLPPLHLLLLDRCSIVVHLNRQVLLHVIRSLMLYSKRTNVSTVDQADLIRSAVVSFLATVSSLL